MKKTMDVVLVPTTHCNLRCSYCYELSRLGDKRRMSHEDVERIFERLAEHFRANDVASARIIWHGGEPLLLPPEFYWKAFEAERKIFGGGRTTIENVVQTNLTVLDDDRITLLRDGFQSVGASLDLFGSLRMNAGGECMEPKALENLERLRAAGVAAKGITVLTRSNRKHIRQIYEFYRLRGMQFRILPLYKGDYGDGKWFEIDPDDTLAACKVLVDLWMSDDAPVVVHPIVPIIGCVYNDMALGQATPLYDKRVWEPLVVIDREGWMYPYSDIFVPEARYGNVFSTSIAEVLKSPVHARVVDETVARGAEICTGCPHLGKGCGGHPAAEGARDFWHKNPDGTRRCTLYKGLVDHIRARLVESKVLEGPALDPDALSEVMEIYS